MHITTKSYVTKVLLDQDGTRAIGVQFKKNGRIYEVLASKEVILSGGAVASPKILMVFNMILNIVSLYNLKFDMLCISLVASVQRSTLQKRGSKLMLIFQLGIIYRTLLASVASLSSSIHLIAS